MAGLKGFSRNTTPTPNPSFFYLAEAVTVEHLLPRGAAHVPR